MTSSGLELTFINTGARREEVIAQVSAYGEYRFTVVETDGAERGVDDGADDSDSASDGEDDSADVLRAQLPAGSRMSIRAGFDRFVDDPSYDHLWSGTEP